VLQPARQSLSMRTPAPADSAGGASEIAAAPHDAGLWTAQELVAAEGHQVTPPGSIRGQGFGESQKEDLAGRRSPDPPWWGAQPVPRAADRRSHSAVSHELEVAAVDLQDQGGLGPDGNPRSL